MISLSTTCSKFPWDGHVKSLEAITPILITTTKKGKLMHKSMLFLDPSESWGYRANTTPQYGETGKCKNATKISLPEAKVEGVSNSWEHRNGNFNKVLEAQCEWA